jgi:glycosyltransferase involved in cell wall biosynthesis
MGRFVCARFPAAPSSANSKLSTRITHQLLYISPSSLSLGVVIPCHNNSWQLSGVLTSIAHQTEKPDAVVVVDDNSDRSEAHSLRQLCRTFGAIYTRLSRPRNELEALGRRSHARNAGTSLVNTDVVLYLDGDMLLSSGYLREVKLYHAALPRIYLRGLRYCIPTEQQSKGFDYCLREFLWKSQATVLSPVAYAGADDHVQHLSAERARPDRWEWCASNNLSVRRRYAIEIGYWDQNFLGWGEEDIDFSFRLFRLGLTPILLTSVNANCYHLDHYVDRRANQMTLRRNAAYLINKWPGIAEYRRAAYAQYQIDVDDLLSDAR